MLLDRLETVFRKEREFVRDASHELRVPMTVCLGNLEVLAATLPDDSESAQVIALVGDEMDRMVLSRRRWVVEGARSGAVVADRHRLTEAVMNLVDNSVRHTEDDDVIPIGATGDPDEVRIWGPRHRVRVPLIDQARIFDRFHRGARAYRTYRGSGLGLSIVRMIAEAHGGRVELVRARGAPSR